MSALWRWLCDLFGPQKAQQTRVGLLNTGELVLVSACGQAQVLNAHTSRLIGETLGCLPTSTLELRADNGIDQALQKVPGVHS